MKTLAWVCLGFSVLAFSCGGGLTDEQRKKIKNEMETSQIKRISEAEVVEEVLAKGRGLTKLLESKLSEDSLERAEGVRIQWLIPGTKNATDMENKLIEAYLMQLSGGTVDNVQKIGTDTLLYTIPIADKQADSTTVIRGIWSIYFTRKQLILGL